LSKDMTRLLGHFVSCENPKSNALIYHERSLRKADIEDLSAEKSKPNCLKMFQGKVVS